ncbi:hypothetical protein K0H71_20095 [Bacillus sp. IITD106]|nr:hypothetical protein [Bacillus sp. IITD106]
MDTVESFVDNGLMLEIPSDTNYWLVRADGGSYYEDFLVNDFIAIADNEISLESINRFPQLNTDIGHTIEGFKALYQETYLKWNSQQISHAASRTMKFITEMKKNDIVIVPSHRSLYFLIGIVESDPFQILEKDVNISGHYKKCPYLKRRKIKWIKEVPRTAISDKMFWIFSTHQTILSLNEHAEHIDRLFTPIYIKNGFCYSSLKVNKKENITSAEWLKLYNVIEMVRSDSDVFVKSNVQSPGLISLLAPAGNVSIIVAVTLLLSGVILGEVNLPGVKVQGIIPYFFGKGKLEREKMRLENERLQLENDKIRIGINLSGQEKKLAESTALEISKELRISAFNAGKTFEFEKKMDSIDSLDEDELE